MKNLFKYILLLSIFLKPLFAQVTIREAFPNLNFTQIVDIQSPRDETNRLFIVSQPGFIYSFENDSTVSDYKIFLDISDQIISGGEKGLLGLAFHPDFEENGYFYVDYTKSDPLRTVISRFYADPQSPDAVDITTEKILLEVKQPYSNHNGGQVAFGPDNYLYVSFGDGGSAGDPENRSQDRSNLLGSIIRINVKGRMGSPYTIPEDNPYFGNGQDYREEIYAYGLRNTWRFSFDSETGELWGADVGQGKWEEIDIIKKGGNYGWRIMEGFNCFNPSSNCDQTGLELPIWEYGHNSDGGYSITGGYVYHGNNALELQNKYIYGDFGSGNIWMLTKIDNDIENELIEKTDFRIATFGVDNNNELYFADYSTGKIYTFKGTQVTGVKKNEEINFSLEQNYPNPFNPSTTIKYQIPSNVKGETSNTKLIVYDILGREVATLVNQNHRPGNYKVNFNASSLPSGTYFYKLTVGNILKVKKMMLLK
ncbi:hypothetical protein MNBD_IGNAVI01-1645 [hydrothermal vent metagenome]|uniref:Glucose/Sorbosone dehydrogenase domain-containing protein n=1 Tax=hydrothermal vent metagenome TaxID=652676 RepID=A0A3B1CBV2_9ZZZZ